LGDQEALVEKSREDLFVGLLRYIFAELLKRATDQLEARIRERFSLMDYEEFLGEWKRARAENEKLGRETSDEDPFSDRASEDYPEAEEEYSEEQEASTEMDPSHQALDSGKRLRWPRPSLILIVFLCVFGVFVLTVVLFMKPEVKRPKFVSERVRLPITSIEREGEPRIPGITEKEGIEEEPIEGEIVGKQKLVVSELPEPPTTIEEREAGNKKVFILREKEPPKQEKEVTVAKGEVKRPEIGGREKAKRHVAMVGEPKGLTIPEGRVPTGKYTVNVGSFRKRVRAERLMKELEDKGYEPFIEKANIAGKGTWYRVAVGRFPSRGEARAFARGLKSKDGINCFVRKPREENQ